MNQRVEPPKDAKTTPKWSKTSPKTAQIEPKSPQERPQTPPRQPKTPPGALLGRSWSHLGSKKSKDRNQERSRSIFVKRPRDFGSILAPQMPPKTTPRRPQNESKIKTKNASFVYRSWTRLRPVLRRFWVDLEAPLGSKVWLPPRRNCISWKIDIIDKMTTQDAFWA